MIKPLCGFEGVGNGKCVIIYAAQFFIYSGVMAYYQKKFKNKVNGWIKFVMFYDSFAFFVCAML